MRAINIYIETEVVKANLVLSEVVIYFGLPDNKKQNMSQTLARALGEHIVMVYCPLRKAIRGPRDRSRQPSTFRVEQRP